MDKAQEISTDTLLVDETKKTRDNVLMALSSCKGTQIDTTTRQNPPLHLPIKGGPCLIRKLSWP
jgi:hypothetical protein